MTLMVTLLRLTVLLCLCSTGARSLWCDRTPAGVNVPKTPGDNGYKIVISGESDKYIPGAVYTIRLQAPGDPYTVEKFSGFLLVTEPADAHSPDSSAGSFQLTTDSLARFSEYCPHAVKHASELPKAEVQVRWTAPPVSAGCVVFRATIIKNKGQWFMDDEALTKQLCPENEFGMDENDNYEPCCACDEAKYELTFEGLWSSLTHPKDFPADTLSAHFSDIIGASHSPNFRFWEYGGEATDGLKNIAETGDPKDLESELKDKSGNIRTIIKARGLKNPKFYGYKTFAVFRADKDHNLISLVSKIDPSPDWFVGVSGLNLCLANCTWTSNKVVNLFPWDAGTNNGITYSQPGDSTFPRDRIRRIVWTNNENSPFYDPGGGMVKPFARLRLVKQRSYDRSCDTNRVGNDDGEEELYDDLDHQNKPECQVSQWTDWTPCSTTCGKGAQTRSRNYVQQSKAGDLGCRRKLFDKKNCYNSASCTRQISPQTYSPSSFSSGSSPSYRKPIYGSTNRDHQIHKDLRNNPCATTSWGHFSQCSATCGRGRKTRERQYLKPSMANDNNCKENLQEHEMCTGKIPDCSDVEQVEPGCETTNWSEWGPCSVTCGKGSRVRTRLFVNSRISHQKCDLEMSQYETCEGIRKDCSEPEDWKEICKLPKQEGLCRMDGNLTRWYFDVNKLRCQKFTYHMCKGNQNNFVSEKDCENACSVLRENLSDSALSSSYGSTTRQGNNFWPLHQAQRPDDGPSIDCSVSEWSDWSRCSSTCGQGFKTKTRYIKVYNQNGGHPCPALKKTRKCKDNTCDRNHPYRYVSFDNYQE
ncbi:unnamed protein product [Allacma fusca]|uniref:Spondin-1 n=1 Tax=Allacma fusca TaxID=39272 RepID=A0A8J2JVP3_9HEXA|nr:unnamed protein product [Allacma fusca]